MKKKSYIVLGAGKYGKKVAEELMDAGMNVMVVDHSEDAISDIADSVTTAVVAEISDSKSLEPLGLSNFDGAIVTATGDLAASVMGVVQCKEAGIPLVISKVADETQAKVMRKLGADKVIIPEHESAARLARSIVMQEYIDVIELSDSIVIVEMEIKPQWVGKSLKALSLPSRFHLNIIAVRTDGKLVCGWDPDAVLPEGSSLVMAADKKDIEKIG